MITDTQLDDVMKKIADIRSRTTERGATQAEAEVAAGMMHRLLLKYNLTHADIDAHAQKTNRAVVDEVIHTTSASWATSLLNTIAQAFSCRCCYVGNGRVTVVGHEHNLIVVRETFAWLKTEAVRLANSTYRDAEEAGAFAHLWRHSPIKWRNDFKSGFVSGVGRAYREAQRATKAEVTTEQWALVPVMEREVAQRFSELFPHTQQRNVSARGSSGFFAGQSAGRGINTNRQVGGSGHIALT